MSHADFVHLHLHTEYSLLDGACRLDRLMDYAHELRFPSLAITDHGVMYGAIDFYKAAREKGIKPIIGCEVYVAPGDRREKKSGSGGKDVYNHLVLLAKDEAGYANLTKLVTAGFLEGYYYKPRIDKEIFAAHKEGLIALSGCLASEICQHLIHDQNDRARDAIDWFKQTLGPENFYLELQNHNIPEQAKVNRHLIPWAKEFGLKCVATNDVHYVKREHWRAHDALICIGTQALISDEKRMRYAEEQFYLRSAEEMKARFAEVPEAVANTLEVAEKCNVEIEFDKLHYPVFQPPEHFTNAGYLRKLLAEGLQRRYGMQTRVEGDEFIIERLEDPTRLPTLGSNQLSVTSNQQTDTADNCPLITDHLSPAIAEAVKGVIDRLQMELRVIEKTGFADYFLIVGDFVQYGRSKGITCVARGSAAGSLVTYLLEISNVDPIRYALLFERFLNPERVNPPDIDIDFADDRRAEVIEYVRNKYGRDAVAQIITFGTMGAKSVVRDLARVMGLGFSDGDRLAKAIPADLKMTLEKALHQSPDFKAAYDGDERIRELIDTAFVLEDLTRNASVHAAGVVIGDQPLVNLLPLKQDEDGVIVTQYAMNPVGDLGLLKMDFLGLKTLTVIRNTCEMVKQGRGIDIPIDHLPLDDAKTYDLLNKANTIGIFQLESGGMRDLCRKFQISSVEHITALVALYRPGPMDLIPDFIKRRHGEVKIEYEHPLLETISKETYGVLIYQEQVMQAAQILGGYTLGGADLLRRAMGKKKPEEMAKHRSIFVKGCKERNHIPEAKANQVFDLLEKFAGYGFNKSHAAAYAIVAYQTAWLKANYPVEFLSAMLTNDMNDTAKLAVLINEARAFNVEVLPPSVNESRVTFAPGATVVAQASRLCESEQKHTGGTPVPPAPTPFTPFDRSRPASIHSRSLPHWQQEGATYFVTFRLADSLPQDVYRRWREERDRALREAEQAAHGSKAERAANLEKLAEEHAEQLERHLDQGAGECWLRKTEVSQIVESALRHFDGDRYFLGSYVLMPNHVHVLVRPAMEHKLSDILQSWKSFSAKEANKLLGRAGEFWQTESFDHIVRDQQQLEKFGRYIEENPVRAGLGAVDFRLGGGSAVAQASRLCESEQKHTGRTPVPPQQVIRFGLAAIKGVGTAAVEAILKARDEGGKFTTLSDLCERVDTRAVNRKAIEALVKCGACDCLGENRATLMAHIDRVLARAQSAAADKARGQSSLFGMFEENTAVMPDSLPKLPEWPQHELLAYEKELLGFYVTGHPLTPFAPILEKYTLHNSVTAAALPSRTMTRLGGLVSALQGGISKKTNKPYSLVTIEDLVGSVQVLCLNENYEKFASLLTLNRALMIIGEVNNGEDKPKVFPQEIMPLEDAPKKFTKQVHFRLHAAHVKPEHLETIRELAERHRGKVPLLLCVRCTGGEWVFIQTNERYSVTPSLELQKAVDNLCGEETYYVSVDTTLPERAQRRWERSADSNGD